MLSEERFTLLTLVVQGQQVVARLRLGGGWQLVYCEEQKKLWDFHEKREIDLIVADSSIIESFIRFGIGRFLSQFEIDGLINRLVELKSVARKLKEIEIKHSPS